MFTITNGGTVVGHGIRRADVPNGTAQGAALLSALAESEYEPVAGDEHTVSRAKVDAESGSAELGKGVGTSLIVWTRTRRRGQ